MKEFSELQNIDFALGTFISGAFVELKSDVGPKPYQEFLGRPPNKQIYRHDAESPRDFLIALKRAKKNEQVDGDIKINLPDLPAIFYYRKPGITNAEDRDFNEASPRGKPRGIGPISTIISRQAAGN